MSEASCWLEQLVWVVDPTAADASDRWRERRKIVDGRGHRVGAGRLVAWSSIATV